MLGYAATSILHITASLVSLYSVSARHAQESALPWIFTRSQNYADCHAATSQLSLMQKASRRNQTLVMNPVSRSWSNSVSSPSTNYWIASLRMNGVGVSLSLLQSRHTISSFALCFAIIALVIAIARMLVVACRKATSENDTEEEENLALEEDDLAMDATRSIGFRERTSYDPKAVVKFIERDYNSWNLLFKVMAALVRFWALLAIMFFALLQGNDPLMDCDRSDLSIEVKHICKYTKACLHSYPIVCANMTLVLMVRVLVQMQLYYSMLKRKRVVDFVDVRIMGTPWPWICAVSMLQGGLHFLLKTYIDNHEVNFHFFQTCAAAGYKFIIPGIMFLSFFPNYTQVENMLVPLNRIVEQEYTRSNRKCPWLSEIEVVNERVLASDVRDGKEDIFERSQRQTQKELLTIDDIVSNLLDNYKNAHRDWLATNESQDSGQSKAKRDKWVFKAMWPTAVFFHTKMDWQHKATRQWMYVLSIMLSVSTLASVVSLFILISFCEAKASLVELSFWREIFSGRWGAIRTDSLIANVVLASHGVIIMLFLYRTIWAMFYRRLNQRTADLAAVGIILVVFVILGFFAKVMA